MSDKQVLIDLGNIRITEYNELNVQIEKLEEVFNPKTNQTETKWRFKGYSDTILGALEQIQRKELLVEKNVQMGLENYLKSVRESNQKILDAISNLKESV